jgi:hypothetical protein
MKKTLSAALLLAASLIGHVASAGELILYSHEGFNGRQVVLEGAVNDFNEFGFNDRASSVVVRSGTWELCEHSNFRGACAIFQRGEYPDLRRFNNAFSSAREVGRPHGWEREGRGDRDGRDDRWRERERERDENRDYGGWRNEEREIRSVQPAFRTDAVELFDDNGLRGRRVPIGGDIRTLRDVGFNDHANSMIINEGTWELCEHADYQGQCRVFGPGRYPDLREFSDRISSLRRVR